MAIKNDKDYVYLIWKSHKSRQQYIVGQLTKNGGYEFQYGYEIKQALDEGFLPFMCFPNLEATYKNTELFPIFLCRLPDRKRKDIKKILGKYGLNEYDAYTLLKRSGTKLPIDNLMFIDPIFNLNEPITRIFPLAGVRHYLGCNGEECCNSVKVSRGDEVFFEMEKGNKWDKNAIRILDIENNILGYIPRYYSEGLSELIAVNKNVQCNVYEVGKSENCNECIKVILKINQ